MKYATNFRSMLAPALLLLAASAAISSQQSFGQSSSEKAPVSSGDKAPVESPVPPALPPIVPSGDGPPAEMQASQERMRNNDRQKQMVLDSQKLVALANELKIDVDKSTKDTMSLDVIRKADEIEKLAHSIKDKMKGE